MKKIKQLRINKKRDTFSVSLKKIEKTTKQLVDQHNEMIDEIRLIKSKLRVNSSFGKRR